jgi:hypothetical protein
MIRTIRKAADVRFSDAECCVEEVMGMNLRRIAA